MEEEPAEQDTEILLGAGADEVWVNNVELIKDADHKVQCGQGTASYDPNTHVLTLENATVNTHNAADQTYQSYVWLNTANDCTIALKGNNSIGFSGSSSYAAIRAACNLAIEGIEGLGTLVIDAGGDNKDKNFNGISSDKKNITIQDTTITMKNTAVKDNSFHGITHEKGGNITISNTTLNITDYNTSINGNTIRIEGDSRININASGPSVGVTFGINGTDISIQNSSLEYKTSKSNPVGKFRPIYGTNSVELNDADVNITTSQGDKLFNCINSQKNMVINNNSNIKVEGKAAAIYAKTGITIENSDIQAVSTENNAIWSLGTLDISGSKINSTSSNYTSIYAKGTLAISGEGTNITAKGHVCGLRSDGNLTISGGEINSTSSNNTSIYAKGTLAISGEGTDITTNGYYHGLQSDGNLTINGGKIDSKSSQKASIYTNGTLAISGEGTDIITNGYLCGLQSVGNLTISGGKIDSKSTENASIYTDGTLEISGGEIIAQSSEQSAIRSKVDLKVSGTPKIEAEGKLRGLQSDKNMLISGGEIIAASSTSVAIMSQENLQVSGTPKIEANGRLYGLYAYGDMVFNGGILDAVSSNNLAIFGRTIDISGGKVHAKGLGAIAARCAQQASEAPSAVINIGDMVEKNKAKLAVSEWFPFEDENVKETRSWTSFIPEQDKTLEIRNSRMRNAVYEVWLASPYKVTFDVNGGTGGNIIEKVYPGNTVEPPVSLTKPGFWLAGWLTETDSYFDFSSTPVNQDMTLRAVWVPNVSYYTIEASAGEHGTVTPSGSISVREYTDQTFTFTPDEGYETAEVLVDGKKVETADSYRFESVTSSHTIAVSFLKKVPDTYPGGTVAKPDGSFVTPGGVVILPDGTVILNDKDKTELKPDNEGNKAVVNKDGTVTVQDGSVRNPDGTYKRPARPIIERTVVKGNRVNIYLREAVAGAAGYDYVISPNPNCIVDKDYTRVNKNILLTNTSMLYVQQDTYYAYCHSWFRGSDGKKVFSQWSEPYEFNVADYTPDTPSIVKVTNPKKGVVVVTVSVPEGAKGFDVILGRSTKNVNGEKRPVDYGTDVRKNRRSTLKTVTFNNVKPGRIYVALHSYTRAQGSNIKVFSPWSEIYFKIVK